MLLETRPGEGGDDALAFAQELHHALLAHARSKGWRVTERASDGRTLVAHVKAPAERMEPYAGTHRIQRIPKNDRRGRRHTSTATVAVLPDAGRAATDVRPDEVDITAWRGGGPGGQHRNTTDTDIRAVHRPTGITVIASGKSQHRNREDALAELGRRLTALAEERAASRVNAQRREQFAGGDRSAKSFTVNEQRGTVLDHSTGRTWRIKDFMRGRLD